MENELYHHGIEGQEWGKRNGPPYPLDRKEHNRIVRSAEATGKRNLSYRRSRKYAKRMTDDDLNETIDRLKREEQYRRLVSQDKENKKIAKQAKKLNRQAKKQAKENEKKAEKDTKLKEQQQKEQKRQQRIQNSYLLARAKRVGEIATEKLATKFFENKAKEWLDVSVDDIENVGWTKMVNGTTYKGTGKKQYDASAKEWWYQTVERPTNSKSSTDDDGFVKAGPVIPRDTLNTSLATLKDITFWE